MMAYSDKLNEHIKEVATELTQPLDEMVRDYLIGLKETTGVEVAFKYTIFFDSEEVLRYMMVNECKGPQ